MPRARAESPIEDCIMVGSPRYTAPWGERDERDIDGDYVDEDGGEDGNPSSCHHQSEVGDGFDVFAGIDLDNDIDMNVDVNSPLKSEDYGFLPNAPVLSQRLEMVPVAPQPVVQVSVSSTATHGHSNAPVRKRHHLDGTPSVSRAYDGNDDDDDQDDGDELLSRSSDGQKKGQKTASTTCKRMNKYTKRKLRAKLQEVKRERDANRAVILNHQRLEVQLQEAQEATKQLKVSLDTAERFKSVYKSKYEKLEGNYKTVLDEKYRLLGHVPAFSNFTTQRPQLGLSHEVVKVDWEANEKRMNQHYEAEKTAWSAERSEMIELANSRDEVQSTRISELEVALKTQATKIEEVQRRHDNDKSAWVASKSWLIDQANEKLKNYSLSLEQEEARGKEKSTMISQLENTLDTAETNLAKANAKNVKQAKDHDKIVSRSLRAAKAAHEIEKTTWAGDRRRILEQANVRDKDKSDKISDLCEALKTEKDGRRATADEYEVNVALLLQQREEAQTGQRKAEEELQQTRRILCGIILQCRRLGIPMPMTMPEQGEGTRNVEDHQ